MINDGHDLTMEQANMMPNGMSGPSQGMQRPEGNNSMQTLFNKLIVDMRAQMPQFVNSWQATYDMRDRATKIMQL